MRRAAPAVLCATLAGLWPGGADAGATLTRPSATPARPSVLFLFVAADEPTLAALPGASVGIVSAAQGRYSPSQLALDIGQGARVATSAYSTPEPAPLTLVRAGTTAQISGWPAAVRRARAAPQLLTPGLLGAAIPGGAAYAGLAAAPSPDAAVAADEAGRVAAASLGSAASLPARVAALARDHGLVVADLPRGARGLSALRSVLAARRANQPVLVLQRSSDASTGALLWCALIGLTSSGAHELSSPSTQERGLVASVDIAPSIIRYLGVHLFHASLRGRPIALDGTLDSARLRATMARLRVLGGRRLKALGFLALTCVALLALAGLARAPLRTRVVRCVAIAFMWAPVATLITAALEPGAGVEYATIVAVCLGLGAATELLLVWPRAMLAPALAAVIALSVDALAHTQLLMRSLLGPNPLLGARFYGIGNELKSALAVLVLAAVAGALYPAARDRRALAALVGAGALLALVEGSARIGAGVGGVILVSAGFAVASVLLLPGALSRRRALVVAIVPLVALVALVALDLAAAHGSGHFTASVLHAHSAGDLRDVIVRRYEAAWGELRNHAMPLATALALALCALAIRRREALLEPVRQDPAWQAALGGGLTAGVVGALVEDSGPVLLVVAVFALGCVASYMCAAPPTASADTPGTRREARSRARTPPAARAR